MTYSFNVEKENFVDAGVVSSKVKRILKQIGIPTAVLRNIAVACYEAEINMIIHSYGGEITLDIDDEGNVTLVFADVGPGIPDVEKALTPGWSTASAQARQLGFGAGMGLVNIKRVSDTFDLQTSPSGTTITITFRVA
ncbi:MAG: ATP-binding protein [Erysipelotrichaceae bacterium]|nr:ATP-binding protein [Erysipelotrichaceae bacterium]MBQ9841092.1 ATP-binding protein [Erysipelotrichaceae bacterium]